MAILVEEWGLIERQLRESERAWLQGGRRILVNQPDMLGAIQTKEIKRGVCV